jgi:ribose transport system permease protein
MSTMLGILTLGQAIVIMTGGIDLSNGALLGLTSILGAWIALNYGIPVILVGTLVVVVLVGCVSALLITKFDFPPLIATLVSMGIAQGLTLVLTGGAPLALNSALLSSFGIANIAGVPFYSLIWVGLVVITYVTLTRTVFGRHVYALGGSERAAFRCGIRTNKIKFGAYLISASLAWFAGVIYLCYTAAGAPRAGGFNYMFDSISATIIGGISLSGGRGNILDASLGVMFYALLYMTVIFLNISPVLEGAFRGILLLVVVLYAFLREKGKK